MPTKLRTKSSALFPLGVILVLLCVVGSGLLRGFLPSMQPGVLRSLALVSTDLAIVGIIAGVWLIFSGKRRNKKWEKEGVEGTRK